MSQEEEDTAYKEELRQSLKAWIFTFLCKTCTPPGVYAYVTKVDEGSKTSYSQPPMICCGNCHEVLYNIKSKDMYNLLHSLFDTGHELLHITIDDNPPF